MTRDKGGETWDPARWRDAEAARKRLQARLCAGWSRLALEAAERCERAGLGLERIRAAGLQQQGPPRGAIGRAEAAGDEAELERLRAWRQLALRAGRIVRQERCGEGEVLQDVEDDEVACGAEWGSPLVRLLRCDLRTCPRCASRRAHVVRRRYDRITRELPEVPLFATLTTRPPPPTEQSDDPALALDVVAGALRRWTRSAVVAGARVLVDGEERREPGALDGGLVALEVTRSTPARRRARAAALLSRDHDDDARAEAERLNASARTGRSWWHAHAHALVVVSQGRKRVTEDELFALTRAWQAALRAEWHARGWAGDPGGWLKLEAPRRGRMGALREVLKYITKGTDLASCPDDDVARLLEALEQRQTSRAWGTFRDLLREPTVEEEQDALTAPEAEAERAVVAVDHGAWPRLRTADGRELRRDHVRWRRLDGGSRERVAELQWVATQRWRQRAPPPPI